MVPAIVLMYVTANAAAVGDITTFTDPEANVSGPRGITAGPDGDVWFASTFNDRIGRIATTSPFPPAPSPAQPVPEAPRFTG